MKKHRGKFNLMKNNIFVDICGLFNGSEVIKKGFDFYSIGNNSSFRKII